jgi:xanthine dehydrogenase accessory factor
MTAIILIRGGGDLASGVALRLWRAGLGVVIAEQAHPLLVRRGVAFGEAINAGRVTIEGITALRVEHAAEARSILAQGRLPVLVDPQAQARRELGALALVDGRMTKRSPDLGMEAAELVIGLGPGFVAGQNCHALVETKRGHSLGRVIWQGAALPDTGIPEGVGERRAERVLRAPVAGSLIAHAAIGDRLEAGQLVAEVAGVTIVAPFKGVLRGLIFPGTAVWPGLKVGDVDPRDDPAYCWLVSDKALAVGGGVLEALLSTPDLRRKLWV